MTRAASEMHWRDDSKIECLGSPTIIMGFLCEFLCLALDMLDDAIGITPSDEALFD